MRDDTTNISLIFIDLTSREAIDRCRTPLEYVDKPDRGELKRLRQEWEAEKRRAMRPIRTTAEYRAVKALRHARKKAKKVNHRKLRRRS